MHSLRLLSLAAFVSAAILLSASAVFAEAIVTITGCDSVLINGNRYLRITFRIHDPAPDMAVCKVSMSPQRGGDPSDSCSFVQSSGPDGWESFGTLWISDCTEAGSIAPGGTLGGFQVVLTRASCCFDVVVTGIIDDLLDFPHEVACFRCDLQTPAEARTWGELKAAYR